MSSQIIDDHKRTFLPAAGRDFFLPLYDPLTSLLGGDRARRHLIEQANISSGQRILDIGCGTGTLAVQLKKERADVEVVGLDPDPKALRRARAKTTRAGVSVQFDQGFADALPYESSSFHRVLSSLMFHHLEDETREKTLREVLRVLKPGGSFHLFDFTGGLTTARENAYYTWLSDAGSIRHFTTRPPDRASEWTTAGGPGEQRLWLVVRDGHLTRIDEKALMDDVAKSASRIAGRLDLGRMLKLRWPVE